LDFAEAQKEAFGCTKCGLCHSRTQVVFGEGPLNAELFVVGEAPGFNEDKEGKPFRGASGLLLERLLSSAGLDRERVYMTTLNKCRPPGSPPRSPKPLPPLSRGPARCGGPEGRGRDGGPREPGAHGEKGDGLAHPGPGHPTGRALRLPDACPVAGALHPGGKGAPDI
jgi:hypothetical protein